MTKRTNIMLIYPPGKLYQRGEDRCQGNIEDSSATSIRACNDLGYAAAVLENDYNIFLRDYQTERKTLDDVRTDIAAFKPDMVMISVTNGTIFEDINFAAEIKKCRAAKIVFKGAIFYAPERELLDALDLSNVDFLIGGEVEDCVKGIADYCFSGAGDIARVDNILYKEGGEWKTTRFHVWREDLDSIPFPARKFMNNALYVRPDTGEAMATIQTSRGCSASCIYCLSPEISGKVIRCRSPENVLKEIEDCFYNFGIKNFFFKADTFTMNREWTLKLCALICASPLRKKIAFTANSRSNPISFEVLKAMKDAGCFAVAFGFESGSNETLKRVKKGSTVEKNLQAARWAAKAGLKVFAFFMAGFPWETEEDLRLLRKHIFDINADFIELHLALPYYGTELYNICKESGVLVSGPLGSNYFDSNVSGTQTVPLAALIAFRNKTTRDYYTRPSYILRRLLECVRKPAMLKNYIRYGLKLLRKTRG